MVITLTTSLTISPNLIDPAAQLIYKVMLQAATNKERDLYFITVLSLCIVQIITLALIDLVLIKPLVNAIDE